MCKVHTHLVGESRAHGLSMNARALEIFRAKQLGSFGIERSEHIWIAAGSGSQTFARFPRSASSVVPSTFEWLARICSTSVDPEARHADDEYRLVARCAKAAPISKELRREQRPAPINVACQIIRIVPDFHPVQRIGFCIGGECLLVKFSVVVRFSQREQHFEPDRRLADRIATPATPWSERRYR